MIRQVRSSLEEQGLHLVGGFHPLPDDALPQGTGTVLVAGNIGSSIYASLQASPEFSVAHPVDRWTRRVIGMIAEHTGATAVFPFDGPPFHPFQRWARRADPR